MAYEGYDSEGYAATNKRTKKDEAYCHIPDDPTEAYALAQDCVSMWEQRDERIMEMRQEYALAQIQLKQYEERVSVHDAAILIDKFAEELSRVDLHIQVAPGTPDDREPAQRIEDAAYFFLDEVKSRHTQQLQGTFQYDASFYLTGDGWLVAECMVDDSEQAKDFPWKIRLLDPICIYPDREQGKPEVVVHRYEASLVELEAYWGKDRVDAATEENAPWRHRNGPLVGGGGAGPRTQYRTCYGFYTHTHTAVLLEGGGWLKKPVEHHYGTMPIIIAIAPGIPWRRSQQMETDHVPLVGPSFLRAAIGVIRDKARIAARVMRMLTKTAAPPHFFATSDPDATADDVDVEPNAVTLGRQGDALTPVVPPPVAFQYASNLMAMEQDQLNRGTVAPPLFAEGAPGSGFDRTKQLGTSFSKIEAYLEVQQEWYQSLLRLMLRQFAYFGGPDMRYIARDRQTGLRTAANRLNPFEVVGADTRLEVKFGNLLSNDLQAMGMLAATLIDRGVISAEYALTELLKVDNPTAVIAQARSDQFYKNPDNLRLAMTWDKLHDSMDEVGRVLALAQFPFLWQQFMEAQQPKPPQPPPGMGGMPGQPGPPLAGSGIPSAAMPPAMGAGAGLPPGVMALGAPQVGAGIQNILPPGIIPGT